MTSTTLADFERRGGIRFGELGSRRLRERGFHRREAGDLQESLGNRISFGAPARRTGNSTGGDGKRGTVGDLEDFIDDWISLGLRILRGERSIGPNLINGGTVGDVQIFFCDRMTLRS